MQQIKIKRVHPNAQIPSYQTAGAAAFDFHLVEEVRIAPKAIAKARTGLVIAVPEGHALILASRSSSPIKKGIALANGIGVVDSDYQGPEDEISLLLQNLTEEEVILQAGDRVAQGMILSTPQAIFQESDETASESRGGFGSTGG